MSDETTHFLAAIPLDDAQGAEEKQWVANVLRLLKSTWRTDHEALRTMSDHLTALDKETQQGVFPGFRVTLEEQAITIQEDPKDAGNLDTAALFIAAFLQRWRPGLAVKVPYRRVREAGTLLVGPAGITRMRGKLKGTRR